MNFLPAAVAALHLLVLLLLFVATLDKGWWVLPDAQALNLWYDCAPQNRSQGWECSSLGLSPVLRGVQGLTVAALLLSALGLLLFLWQLLGGPRGRLFLPSAAAQLLAGLAALLAAGLFAAGGGRAGGGRPGHCPVLAGLGGALALASGGGVPAPADTGVSRTHRPLATPGLATSSQPNR
ncbi:epithelial membrane protein 3-like [Corvus hawaiiensis]|uniref:epithelial membrane protein 3-like n=1 Tax=Corvus hawaiiensis TaxID=134902 RepID=UPI002018C337|nr:epithelial membrane protein 3-like [Corvus hawaiiensis]XP_048149283.1 epithelial membrane protein 3-like [Corvus hawaiiensis]